MGFAGDLNGRLEKSKILCVPLIVSTHPDLWTYHVWAIGERVMERGAEEKNGAGINRCWVRKEINSSLLLRHFMNTPTSNPRT